MKNPETLRYTKSHEWLKALPGGLVEIGLTNHAQEELGDLVFVNLPQPGDEVNAGESFGDVESVKAVSDVYSSVAGKVAEVNEALLDNPAAINQAPYEAWFIRVEAGEDALSEADTMNAAEYGEYIAGTQSL